MNIILTGCAGFIGSHVLQRLLELGHRVIGVDNLDPYYARSIKMGNIDEAKVSSGAKSFEKKSNLPAFDFLESDLADNATYRKLSLMLAGDKVDAIIHLAAKAGVRPSIENPVAYQRSNVISTQNLLEYARANEIRQFVFASSSSVYGINSNVPWKEEHAVLQPISPYASTKVSCELLGHVYSHLYGIRFLGLRFFTVFGPRQRPDLAINKFVRLIKAGKPIPVFGDGSTSRDYTYIDDIVNGIIGALQYEQSNYEVINLGNSRTISLKEMITTIEKVVGQTAIIDRQPEQPGDVRHTWADISRASELLGYQPETSFEDGLRSFVRWQNARQADPVV